MSPTTLALVLEGPACTCCVHNACQPHVLDLRFHGPTRSDKVWSALDVEQNQTRCGLVRALAVKCTELGPNLCCGQWSEQYGIASNNSMVEFNTRNAKGFWERAIWTLPNPFALKCKSLGLWLGFVSTFCKNTFAHVFHFIQLNSCTKTGGGISETRSL